MEPQPFLNMYVRDLLGRFPETIPVFLRHHLICVGCCMAPFDTLQDVTRNYHLNPQRFIDELTQAIYSSDPMI